jgi:hypothetical protein
MTMIHVNRGATSVGIFSEEEVREGLRSGRFASSDLGWREGMPNWQPLSQFPELASAAPAPPPPSAIAATITSKKTEPLAIWSLVLSILGLLCCAFIFAVPGVICGHLALSKVRKEPNLEGTGIAVAGLTIGYVGIAIWLIWFVFFGAAFFQGLAQGMSKH